MWSDELNTKNGTVYMEIDGHKVKLSQRATVRLEMDNKYYNKSWRNKIWSVWERDTWYEGLIHFCNRNAAIMLLKRYGKPGTFYMFGNLMRFGASVRVENGYVYFCNTENGLMFTVESKRTHPYAVRNN